MATMTPERRMKKKVDEVLKEFGIWFFCPQSGIYGRSGIPDRIACWKGRFIGIEVKAPEAKRGMTALQERTMIQMREAGAVYWLVDSDEALLAFRTACKLGTLF